MWTQGHPFAGMSPAVGFVQCSMILAGPHLLRMWLRDLPHPSPASVYSTYFSAIPRNRRKTSLSSSYRGQARHPRRPI